MRSATWPPSALCCWAWTQRPASSLSWITLKSGVCQVCWRAQRTSVYAANCTVCIMCQVWWRAQQLSVDAANRTVIIVEWTEEKWQTRVYKHSFSAVGAQSIFLQRCIQPWSSLNAIRRFFCCRAVVSLTIRFIHACHLLNGVCFRASQCTSACNHSVFPTCAFL
jgi:hypothetical protein